MSGHSKWSTIKHKKAVVDAKRGKVFSKLARLIAVESKVVLSLLRYRPRAIYAAAHEDLSTTEPHDPLVIDQWLFIRVEAGRVNTQDLIVDTSRLRHLTRGLNELPAATIDNEVATLASFVSLGLLASGNCLSNECIHFCQPCKVIDSL